MVSGCALPRVSVEEQLAPATHQDTRAAKDAGLEGGPELSPSMTMTDALAMVVAGANVDHDGAGSAGATAAANEKPAQQASAGSSAAMQPSATAAAGAGAMPPVALTAPTFASWPVPSSLAGSKAKPSYTVDEKTVTDNVTHLVWQRNVPLVTELCGGQFNARPGTEPGACSWEEARQFCASASLAAALGSSGWRLPSKVELESLIDETRAEPAIDVVAFPKYPATEPGLPASLFWTDTTYVRWPDWAWALDLTSGEAQATETSRPWRVRCVRSLESFSSSTRLTDQYEMSDGTLTDRKTQLTWQRTDDGTYYTWSEAREHCQSEGSGWRLPSFRELLSIVDPTRIAPAIDIGGFPSAAPYAYWSGSLYPAGNEETAWTVHFEAGNSSTEALLSTHYVRCVR